MYFGVFFIVPTFVLPIASQLFFIQYGDFKTLNTVSGFYGPGAFLAWLLPALNTFLCSITIGTYNQSALDLAGFLGTVAYPIQICI